MVPGEIITAAGEIEINAGRQILTAADPLPDDLRDAIAEIDNRRRH